MKFELVEKKVQSPPAAHNVARLLDPESETRTIENIARFAVSVPVFNYRPAEVVIRDRVALSLNLETAIKTVRSKGAPAGKSQNEALVKAFFSYEEKRRYSDARVVDGYRGQFKISRNISVPTVPTFTILEDEKLIPVVLCGWKKFSLRRQQIRAWLSMLDSGLFSFADFRASPWEVLVFAEKDSPDGPVRKPRVIKAGEYNLMSSNELREMSFLYANAQKQAMPLAREMWEKREQVRQEKERSRPEIQPGRGDVLEPDQPDMFAFEDNEKE